MASIKRNFTSTYYYHVYNCGVEKRRTFLSERDYQRFIDTITYYRHQQKISYSQFINLDIQGQKNYLQLNPPRGENRRIAVAAYCLMPNHFHLLIKQLKDGGITEFVSDISNSYTKYFNSKNRRIGYLFQGTFKARVVDDEESFLQVSRYIHLNPRISVKVKWENRLESYPYSSYRNWINEEGNEIIDIGKVKEILTLKGRDYQEFVESKSDSGGIMLDQEMSLESE